MPDLEAALEAALSFSETACMPSFAELQQHETWHQTFGWINHALVSADLEIPLHSLYGQYDPAIRLYCYATNVDAHA